MKIILLWSFVFCLSNFGNAETESTYNKYKFAFDTGDTGAHSRREVSNAPGHVTGQYQYKDPNGILRTIRYKSSPEVGFQAFGEGIPYFSSGYELKPSSKEEDSRNSAEIIMALAENTSTPQTSANDLRESLSAVVNSPQDGQSAPVYTLQEAESVPIYTRQENNPTSVYSPKQIQPTSDRNFQALQSDSINNVEDSKSENGASHAEKQKKLDEIENIDSLQFLVEDKSSGGIKKVTSLESSLNAAGIKIIHPPLFPYGFYRIPITVPLLSFPHTLPFVTNRFHYLL